MRLVFVVPRYGVEITGGAETLCRDYAERLLDRGHRVRVLTTCATDHFTWENHLPAGETVVRGVPVERHPVSVPKDLDRVGRLEAQLAAGVPLLGHQSREWVRNMGYSTSLLEAVERHAATAHAVLFVPYLFASTAFGVQVAPQRSLVIPCLHDEPYARFPVLQDALRSARGLLFNTVAERAVAERVLGALPPNRVVGIGVDPLPAVDAAAFRRRERLEGDLLCYAGRREAGKNWDLLLEWSTLYNQALSRRGPSTLVSMGSSPVRTTQSSARVVRDLGFVDAGTKYAAMSASVATAQLSRNESFSYVLMESWLAGTPVVVHADAEVTRLHCEESGGGVWVRSAEAFAEALDRLRGDAPLRQRMGEQGRRFVEDRYSWSRIVGLLESAIEELMA